jgi:hypothetical protein
MLKYLPVAGLGGFDLGFGSGLSEKKMCICYIVNIGILKHLMSLPFIQLVFTLY